MMKDKRILFGCVLAPIFACGIGGFLLIPKLKPMLDPNAILKEAKAVGLPVTAKELLSDPPIPQEKNAYRTLVQLNNLSAENETEKELADFIAGKSGETPAIKALYEKALELRKFDRFEPKLDRDKPIETLRRARTIATMFGLPLRLAVGFQRQRDFPKALALIDVAYHSQDLMADAPDWAFSARGGTYRASTLRAQFNLMTESANLAELELTSQFVERLPKEVQFDRVLSGLAYDAIADARIASGTRGTGPPRRSGPPSGPLEAHLCAVELEPLIHIKMNLKGTPDLDRWVRLVDDAEKRTQGFDPAGMKSAKLKILRDSIRRHRAIPTYRAMLRVAKRLLEHGFSTGSFPKTLGELGIDLKDVGGKENVRYQQHLKGFVLYSHGPNEVDEGGPIDGERAKGYDDFGFVFNGPVKRKVG